MKQLFALAAVALITAPAGAHSVRTSDGFEVEPTHCVRDGLIVGMLQFRHDLGNLDTGITTTTITIENHSLDPTNTTNTVFLATSIKTTTGASNESNSRKISIPFH